MAHTRTTLTLDEGLAKQDREFKISNTAAAQLSVAVVIRRTRTCLHRWYQVDMTATFDNPSNREVTIRSVSSDRGIRGK